MSGYRLLPDNIGEDITGAMAAVSLSLSAADPEGVSFAYRKLSAIINLPRHRKSSPDDGAGGATIVRRLFMYMIDHVIRMD